MPEQRLHKEASFELLVRSPYAEAAKLFGPEGERVWAGPDWDPRFLFPQPARDVQGAVFTNGHGSLEATWVIARHDLDARYFQYVYVIPAILACTIDVLFSLVDDATTRVHVTYARTALTPEGDKQVAAMAEGDRRAGPEWQAAIDACLAGAQSA